MRRATVVALTIAVTAAVCVAALPAAAQDSSTESKVLRFGWAQDPKTLNPFTGVNEEEYQIWSLSWDLLVNFDPEDLGPSPTPRKARPRGVRSRSACGAKVTASSWRNRRRCSRRMLPKASGSG